MLFSAVTLVLIALVSLYSFLLLVDTKMVVPGSFGGRPLAITQITGTKKYQILGVPSMENG